MLSLLFFTFLLFAIETYPSSLEEKVLDIDIPKDKFTNLSQEKRDALYSFKNDNTKVIKGTDKGSGIVLGQGRLFKRRTYAIIRWRVLNGGNQWSIYLWNVIITALNMIRAVGDLSADTSELCFSKDSKFARFYLLPKIHKRLHNVPSRPVISRLSFVTSSQKGCKLKL